MCGGIAPAAKLPAAAPGSVAGAQAGGMSAAGHAHGGGHGHGPELAVPQQGTLTASMLVDGSFGPTVKKGKAKTITIEDGRGYGNVKGRKQNGGDKKQNNYSVTDANFYPSLGLLKADPDTGKPLNYVQHIQAYNAVGYVSTFHPEVYAKLVEQQNAGNGTVLGSALALLGIVKTADPAMRAAGLSAGMLAQEAVPGTNGALNARDVVMSGEDISGEQWARPHHAESSWPVYKQLIDAGLDYKTAMTLSGDDAVSGSGRLNGFNNQDGKTGLNADERAVYQLGARVQQQTGIPVIQIMAGGHSHTGLDESAKTKPKINKIIGFDSADRSASAQRTNAIYQALLDGRVAGGNKDKFKVDADGAFKNAAGTPAVLENAIAQAKLADTDAKKPAGATGGSAPPPVQAAADAVAGAGGCGAAGGAGGCGHGGAVAGAEGAMQAGSPDPGALIAKLQALIDQLTALLASLGGSQQANQSASGGGGSATVGVQNLRTTIRPAAAADAHAGHMHARAA